jgi:hypothetical protein
MCIIYTKKKKKAGTCVLEKNKQDIIFDTMSPCVEEKPASEIMAHLWLAGKTAGTGPSQS